MLCLLSLDSALKADLCEMKVEILQQKALDARRNRNMWIGAGELDFFLLQNLMTFDKEKAFTDMQEAGNLLLRLMPVVPQESLGCWHENYRLFMRSLGCFESKARGQTLQVCLGFDIIVQLRSAFLCLIGQRAL